MKKTTVNFNNDVYFLLQKESEKKNKTKTEIINMALQIYLEKNNIEVMKINIENLVKTAIKNIITDDKFMKDLKENIAKKFTEQDQSEN